MKYVIKAKGSLEEYVLLVVGQVGLMDTDIKMELSHVDCIDDATIFLEDFLAEDVFDEVGLHEDDWEVVKVEE
ncbi:hypothetical protein NVP1170O_185 [Vibrio phage 1.170.O._10N.261.52.C3]|nr:hypothetical protein NVP1170O_185 [Vibrio phage 1.170.O._10N.261.52.C3]